MYVPVCHLYSCVWVSFLLLYRHIAKDMLQVEDPDFYEWETHIFFDDAMEPNDEGNEFQINQFVRLLVSQVDEQGGSNRSMLPGKIADSTF